MLSISARGSGASAAAYYETLEGDTKLEDYYAQESAGYYLGSGARAFGLAGAVNRDEFLELAAGKTPFGDVQGASDKHRAGWDLTFSAPKSVSVAWGTADDTLRDAIQAAHDRAVASSIRFVEDHAAFTRRGSGSASDEDRRERVGLVIAAYRHGTSREQDPQLHTHCMTFNCSPRGDGTVGALDSRPLYEWKMATGAVYRGELAAGLRDLGFDLEQDEKSVRIGSVPKALEDEFSKRRQQIVESLKEHGASGAWASEIAALGTRRAKAEVSRDELLGSWRDRAHECSPEWEPTKGLKPDQELKAGPVLNVEQVQSEMTSQVSTLSEAQLYAAVAVNQQLTGGRTHIEQAAGSVKGDLRTIQLQCEHQVRFTTQEMLQLEQQMVDRATAMGSAREHQVKDKRLEAAFSSRPTLSDEQKDVVRHIVQGGDLVCVQGTAGSGKSFALGAAREAWEAEGYRVRGVSLSGKAAQELEKGSGIQSTTIARMEMDTRPWTDDRGETHEPKDALTSKDVLVIDEAGMSGSRQIAALLEQAERAGTKVVMVGDTRQLQAIEAGAAFRAIQERVGMATLDTIQRQYDAQDRQVVRDLRDGRAEAALSNLELRGRIHEYDTAQGAKQAVGQDVVEDLKAGKISLGLTSTRAEARDVNEYAHQAARETGSLRGEDIEISTPYGSRSIAVGDRLLFMRNSIQLDVKNGHIGTVREIASNTKQPQITVELDSGGTRLVEVSRYDHLEYGYAVTAAKSQGSSPDRVRALATDSGMSSRELGYVIGSRAREETHVYGDKSTLAELAPAWSKARQKDVTLDYDSARGRELGVSL